MTETGRPYGGVNEQNESGLPGEVPEKGQVSADPDQSPRAAQGGMSDDVTHVPGNGSDPDGKAPGIADATGPQG
jgi:hypothetical protein